MMTDLHFHTKQHTSEPDLSRFTEDSTLDGGYRVKLLVRLMNAKCDPAAFDADAFAARLSSFGQAVEVTKTGTALSVRMDTAEPDRLLCEAQTVGEFLTVSIENPSVWESSESAAVKPRRPRKPFGVVAAATGTGIRDTLLSMGADRVPDGSMGLTAQMLADECRAANADCVLLFPNTPSLSGPAAEAARLCTDCDVRVIPCGTVGACCAALSLLDTSSGDRDAVTDDMTAAAEDTVVGVVRPDDSGYAGLSDGRTLVTSPDRPAAVLALCDKLRASGADVLLMIVGAGAPEDEARALCASLTRAYRRTEVIMIDGGQTDCDYMLTIE